MKIECKLSKPIIEALDEQALLVADDSVKEGRMGLELLVSADVESMERLSIAMTKINVTMEVGPS